MAPGSPGRDSFSLDWQFWAPACCVTAAGNGRRRPSTGASGWDDCRRILSRAMGSAGVPYVELEDRLHSVFASVVGFSFIAGVVATLAFCRPRTRARALGDVAALMVTLTVPLLMATPVWGVLQRLMFFTAAAWYASEVRRQAVFDRARSGAPLRLAGSTGGVVTQVGFVRMPEARNWVAGERNDAGGLTVSVETEPGVMGWPTCGVLAHRHGRVLVPLVDVRGRPAGHDAVEQAAVLCPFANKAATRVAWQVR